VFSPITSLKGANLQWTRDPDSKLTHLLSSAEGLVATLSFAGVCRSMARGETAHGSWTFKREGFLHPRVSIRRSGSDATIGILSLSAGASGTLTLSGGAGYRFVTSGWSRKRWRFDKGDRTVVRFERARGGAIAIVEDMSEGEEVLSILSLLGIYLPLLADAEESAMAASMAAVIACM
jgi:hypothetical protein